MGTRPRTLNNELVPEARLELARYCYRRILNPLRLPFRHTGTGAELIADREVARMFLGARADGTGSPGGAGDVG